MCSCSTTAPASKPTRLIYDQKTKRLHAEGNIRMTDVDGRSLMPTSWICPTTTATASSIRCASTQPTTRAWPRRARTAPAATTRCSRTASTPPALPCRDDPKKPPLWQVKGARIVHDQNEKMLYFETAQLEFFGVPLAYMPYFSTPDPTVKRKSGLLMAGYSSGTTPDRPRPRDALLLGDRPRL